VYGVDSRVEKWSDSQSSQHSGGLRLFYGMQWHGATVSGGRVPEMSGSHSPLV
jgi:hypothetical protein